MAGKKIRKRETPKVMYLKVLNAWVSASIIKV
jgi:hypothetical protein